MALPFTHEQRDAIRERLCDSARRHALTTGVKKTSLDMLTADAGISKSSFYKFFDSKETLFLAIAADWERQILGSAEAALEGSDTLSNKERAAAFVYAVFETIHQLNLARFLREDLPYLSEFMPKSEARAHCLTSAASIFESLHKAHIRFTAPDETVLSVIQVMYLSILSIGGVGESFFPALREIVAGACDRLVS